MSKNRVLSLDSFLKANLKISAKIGSKYLSRFDFRIFFS